MKGSHNKISQVEGSLLQEARQGNRIEVGCALDLHRSDCHELTMQDVRRMALRSLSEFLAGFRSDAEQVFKEFDADGSGSVDSYVFHVSRFHASRFWGEGNPLHQ